MGWGVTGSGVTYNQRLKYYASVAALFDILFSFWLSFEEMITMTNNLVLFYLFFPP